MDEKKSDMVLPPIVVKTEFDAMSQAVGDGAQQKIRQLETEIRALMERNTLLEKKESADANELQARQDKCRELELKNDALQERLALTPFANHDNARCLCAESRLGKKLGSVDRDLQQMRSLLATNKELKKNIEDLERRLRLSDSARLLALKAELARLQQRPDAADQKAGPSSSSNNCSASADPCLQAALTEAKKLIEKLREEKQKLAKELESEKEKLKSADRVCEEVAKSLRESKLREQRSSNSPRPAADGDCKYCPVFQGGMHEFAEQVKAKTAEVEALNRANAELKRENEELTLTNANYAISLEHERQATAGALQDKEQTQTELTQANNATNSHSELKQSLSNQLQELSAQLQQCRAEKQLLANQLAQAKRDNDDLKAKVKVAEKYAHDETAALRSKLAALQVSSQLNKANAEELERTKKSAQELHARRVKDLEAKLDAAVSLARKTQDTLESERMSRAALVEVELSSIRAQLATTHEQELAAVEARSVAAEKNYEVAIERKKTELAAQYEAEMSSLRTQLAAKYEKDMSTLREQLAAQQDRNRQALKNYEEALERKTAELTQMFQQRLENADEKLSGQQNLLGTYIDEAHVKDTTISKLNAEISDLFEQIGKQKSKIVKLEAKEKDLNGKFEDLKKSLKSIEPGLDASMAAEGIKPLERIPEPAVIPNRSGATVVFANSENQAEIVAAQLRMKLEHSSEIAKDQEKRIAQQQDQIQLLQAKMKGLMSANARDERLIVVDNQAKGAIENLRGAHMRDRLKIAEELRDGMNSIKELRVPVLNSLLLLAAKTRTSVALNGAPGPDDGDSVAAAPSAAASSALGAEGWAAAVLVPQKLREDFEECKLRLAKLQKENEELRNQNRNLKTYLKPKVDQMKSDQEVLNKDCRKLLAEAEENLRKAPEEWAKLFSSTIKLHEERNTELANQLTPALKDQLRFQKQAKEAEAKVAPLNEHCAKLQTDHDALSKLVKELQGQLEQAQSETRKLKLQLQQSQGSVADESEVSADEAVESTADPSNQPQQSDQIANFLQTIAELNGKLADCEGENVRLLADSELAAKVIEEFKLKLKQIEAEKESAQAAVSELQTRVQSLLAAAAESVPKMTEVVEENTRLGVENKRLAEENAQLQSRKRKHSRDESATAAACGGVEFEAEKKLRESLQIAQDELAHEKAKSVAQLKALMTTHAMISDMYTQGQKELGEKAERIAELEAACQASAATTAAANGQELLPAPGISVETYNIDALIDQNRRLNDQNLAAEQNAQSLLKQLAELKAAHADAEKARKLLESARKAKKTAEDRFQIERETWTVKETKLRSEIDQLTADRTLDNAVQKMAIGEQLQQTQRRLDETLAELEESKRASELLKIGYTGMVTISEASKREATELRLQYQRFVQRHRAAYEAADAKFRDVSATILTVADLPTNGASSST